MDSTFRGTQDGVHGLRLDLLRSATEIYVHLAYPEAVVPAAVSRRLVWPQEGAAEEVLNAPPFEFSGKAPGHLTPVYALRLGNHRYPHMKLQVQTWPNCAGFMLSVNSHDQVSGLDTGSDAQAFRELQVENQRLKEAIEAAWDAAGLPTFLRYLRDYIQNRADESRHSESEVASSGADSPSCRATSQPI